MHELSIAYSIVEVVGEAAQAANAIRVDVVRIPPGRSPVWRRGLCSLAGTSQRKLRSWRALN